MENFRKATQGSTERFMESCSAGHRWLQLGLTFGIHITPVLLIFLSATLLVARIRLMAV